LAAIYVTFISLLYASYWFLLMCKRD